MAENKIRISKDIKKFDIESINQLFNVQLLELEPKTDLEGYHIYQVKSSNDPDVVYKLQNYIDDYISKLKYNDASGDDSSYDSDGTEAPHNQKIIHQDVSRTTSDTLASELEEDVPTSPGYAARVEFALKLGYTESLVQTALQKLGSNPGQNELLAELIKLGSQRTTGDLSPTGSDNGISTSNYDEDTSVIGKLRPIVIDGSNVAMSHGNKEIFSCRGIKICVDWFRARGHQEITVFVPKWRKETTSLPENRISDQDILNELEKERLLVFTPSRLVGGKRMICYDDRYILRLAADTDGIVVSNDNYRDLVQESPEFRRVVEERILMYSFVNDRFMPPEDPLGRSGPTLDVFLRIQPNTSRLVTAPPCPYGKKCTYGNKCKFSHPERGSLPQKSIVERLSEHAQKHLSQRLLKGKSISLPLPESSDSGVRKTPLMRTRSNVPSVSGGYGSPNYSTSDFSSSPPNNSSNESINLHRKLQRQLTLNPLVGGDPRMEVFRKYPNYNISGAAVAAQAIGYSVPNAHKPLSRHSSAGSSSHRAGLNSSLTPSPSSSSSYCTGAAPTCSSAWDLHQQVTRIASAPGQAGMPPPSAAFQPHRLSSASDPQLNLCLTQQQFLANAPTHMPQMGPQHGFLPEFGMNSATAYQLTKENARRKLHYHLSALFPEEQVAHVMTLYPDETNPQKICAAILNIYSKM